MRTGPTRPRRQSTVTPQSATDLATYTQLLAALTKTQAWQDELHRHGWVQVFHPGEEFSDYLDDQEAQIAGIMRVLGFLQ